MPHIAPNVSFTNVSREWRLKWKDEETLRKCQDGSTTSSFIDILHRRGSMMMSSCRDDFLRNASFFFAFFSDSRVEFRKKRSPHSAMHRSDRCPPATNSLHGRLGIDSPHHESDFAIWECDSFTFESDVLKQMEAIEGATKVETQTYTFTDLTKEENKEENKENKEEEKKEKKQEKEQEVGTMW